MAYLYKLFFWGKKVQYHFIFYKVKQEPCINTIKNQKREKNTTYSQEIKATEILFDTCENSNLI